MTFQRSFIAAAVCLNFSLATVGVRAQTADALVDAAIDLRERGDDLQARVLLQQAHAADPSPRTTAQLGLCEQALGLWSDAEAHVRQALTATSDAWIQRNRAALESTLGAVAEHLGDLEILASVAGVTVLVDGRPVGITPLQAPLRVEVGRHEIGARLAGHVDQTATIDVAATRLSRRLFEMELVAPTSADQTTAMTTAVEPVDPSPPVGSWSSPFWSWILLVGTGVSGAASVGLAVHTQSVYEGLRRDCGGAGCSAGEIDASGLAPAETATNVALAFTSVLAAGTTVAFIVELTSQQAPRADPRVQLRLLPGNVVLTGTF